MSVAVFACGFSLGAAAQYLQGLQFNLTRCLMPMSAMDAMAAQCVRQQSPSWWRDALTRLLFHNDICRYVLVLWQSVWGWRV